MKKLTSICIAFSLLFVAIVPVSAAATPAISENDIITIDQIIEMFPEAKIDKSVLFENYKPGNMAERKIVKSYTRQVRGDSYYLDVYDDGAVGLLREKDLGSTRGTYTKTWTFSYYAATYHIVHLILNYTTDGVNAPTINSAVGGGTNIEIYDYGRDNTYRHVGFVEANGYRQYTAGYSTVTEVYVGLWMIVTLKVDGSGVKQTGITNPY